MMMGYKRRTERRVNVGARATKSARAKERGREIKKSPTCLQAMFPPHFLSRSSAGAPFRERSSAGRHYVTLVIIAI